MDSFKGNPNIIDYLTTRKTTRREYGTPVESSIPYSNEVTQKHGVFFPDNAPINNSSSKKNRRKIRSKNTDKTKFELGESSKHVAQNNLLVVNSLSGSLNNLSLKQTSLVTQPVVKISKQPGDLLTDHDLTNKKAKSKSKNKKNKKINSKKIDIDSNSNDTSSESPKIVRINHQNMDSAKESTSQPQDTRRTRRNRQDGKYKFNKDKQKKDEQDDDFAYNEYMTKEEVDIGLKTGELLQSNIRINWRDSKKAYITNPNKSEQDILIDSIFDRNRALEEDLVVVKVKPEEEWHGQQKTGVVVYILEKKHNRTAVGVLKLMNDKNKQFAMFHPRSIKMPRMKIPFTDWPALFYDNADKYEQVLFKAEIKEWTSKYPIGSLLENIGMAGDIQTETLAILKENDLDVSPYSDALKKYYPSSGEIPEEEFKYRMDLRKECIFTIDPLTARDLDDAVSCKELPNGNFEIGVHISDVSYFLKEGNILDRLVSERATSTYMVESVYHMLPRELCMMCSLLPGEDKLAFSVFWEITPDAKVINHKFARTVINSCVQLAYEHAQVMLDNPSIPPEGLPTIYNGFTSQDLSKIVNILNNIAIKLRTDRFEGGALRIDQPKLCFTLDPSTCLPITYDVYENKECHRLIEEFMLLANMTVATQIRKDYPDIAFLRSHPPPSEIMTLQLQKLLETVGIHLDVSSASGFQKSLSDYVGNDPFSQARMLVLNALSAKTMTRAIYFCANNREDDQYYWHYALSIPLYTHFTSPIRRYADIMVHRLLSGSMGYTEKSTWNVEYVKDIAENCNKKKFSAKRAGEQSIELYYIEFIKLNQPVIEEAVVSEVRNSSIDVIILKSGTVCKVNLSMLPSNVKYLVEGEGKESGKNNDNEKKIKVLNIFWPVKSSKLPHRQIITIFSLVKVKLTKVPKKLQINAKLLEPDNISVM